MKNSNKIAEKIGMVLTVGDDIGACFSGFRVHFQIRKYELFHMKNSNKIAEKIG